MNRPARPQPVDAEYAKVQAERHKVEKDPEYGPDHILYHALVVKEWLLNANHDTRPMLEDGSDAYESMWKVVEYLEESES